MALLLLPCALLISLAALFYSDTVLTLPDDGSRADVIVVRAATAATRCAGSATLKQGRSPLILITGDGDCLFNKQIMIRDGVNPSAILVECQSGSTWQNAYYSAAVMRRIRARNAVIVTNWYHSRRAIASFRSVCPQMHFSSSPIGVESTPMGFPPTSADLELIAKEYAKLGWYLASGRILPSNLVTKDRAAEIASVCALQGSKG
ncbi:YdcF family protein [Ochrobactrum pseudogrignonense]|nr:YdcF family protein [Brucella pseudogrignonensis]